MAIRIGARERAHQGRSASRQAAPVGSGGPSQALEAR
jgi:hypothetical protein